MKGILFILLFPLAPAFSQLEHGFAQMHGTWKFVKGECVVDGDTIVQLPDPRFEFATQLSRPYTEIVFIDDSLYEAGTFYFKCPGTQFPGKWSFDTQQRIYFLPGFPDKNALADFNGSEFKLTPQGFVLIRENCRYYFVKKD